MKYIEAAERVQKAGSLQPTAESDDEWLAEADSGDQVIQQPSDSILDAVETSYIDFSCKLLSEILSEKPDTIDKSIKKSTSSFPVANTNKQDNDFSLLM